MRKSKWLVLFAFVFLFLIITACGGIENTANADFSQSVSSAPESSDSVLPEDIETGETGKTLEEAIEQALNQRSDAFSGGEYFSSAYHTLQTDENADGITIYLLATHGWYSNYAGLEEVSGCGVVAGVLRLSYENGGYSVKEYNEYDIKELDKSTKEIFPTLVAEDALEKHSEYYVKMKEIKQSKAANHFMEQH